MLLLNTNKIFPPKFGRKDHYPAEGFSCIFFTKSQMTG